MRLITTVIRHFFTSLSLGVFGYEPSLFLTLQLIPFIKSALTRLSDV